MVAESESERSSKHSILARGWVNIEDLAKRSAPSETERVITSLT
ncbi:hypothetical protein AO9_02020 [Chlamydia psittaci Mat116]|nr:hypothetical protein AO9_02020 [Chlamydia psittaci Mat116]